MISVSYTLRIAIELKGGKGTGSLAKAGDRRKTERREKASFGCRGGVGFITAHRKYWERNRPAAEFAKKSGERNERKGGAVDFRTVQKSWFWPDGPKVQTWSGTMCRVSRCSKKIWTAFGLKEGTLGYARQR